MNPLILHRLELHCFVILLSPLVLLSASAAPASAIDVWVDFTSDFHDGNDGAPNGVADWIDELNEATSRSGGVTNESPSQNQFTAADRFEIENNILADLNQIYDGYSVNFVTLQPAGEHDVVYLGADNDASGVDGSFGKASGDLGNTRTRTYPTNPSGNPGGVSRVFTGNFNGALEPAFNSLQESIDEISTSLAGTAAHEFGHSLGLFHHYTYSAEGIVPSNSSNTGGLQNQHILATGSTGVSEAERESIRTLSPFSRVILDIAGGSQTHGGAAVVNNPVLSDTSELNGGDAGDSLPQAQQLSFSIGESSGKEISFIEADLDNSPTDIDVYRFTTSVEATLTAHVFTSRLPGLDNFDSVLELVDVTGTVLGVSDDIGWSNDKFGDIPNPADDDTGSFLVNLTVDPGSYYLRVSTATTDIDAAASVGDEYWLITSLDRQFVNPGDFDVDGDVDGADFLKWQRDVGNAQELTDWQSNYGGSDMNGLASSHAVPEPNATTLALLALMLVSTSKSRR
ncbi:zinc metalloprotease [Adhaeretor mobilis]|uniref:Uncharacterized protein n=1 Tax=Adhaeretor mobilis TaxID=1930276 RepID=A0A517MRR3_9BACT|nr:hypothetical protein [Adhaeretor mobilis]QDS97571.1 hypothetical protein HG15A2_08340 [Adhaeretor mobilis]